MKGGLEICAAITIILVTFAFTLCQSEMCQLSAAPHPDGVCGDELTVAHASLCFLVRRAYPRYFQDKRSKTLSNKPGLSETFKHQRMARGVSELEQIYRIPLSALSKVRLTEDNWREFLEDVVGPKRSMAGESTGEFVYPDGALEELPINQFDHPKSLIRMLSKRSTAEKRNGLVCECCINVCRIRQMATYC